MSLTVHRAAATSQYATCSARRPAACCHPASTSSAAGEPGPDESCEDSSADEPKNRATSRRKVPRSMPGDPAPAASQSIMPLQESPDQMVLPCHRSPCTNTSSPSGTGRLAIRSSALASSRDVPTDLRHSAKSMSYRSEEHTSELQSQFHLVCRLLLEKKNTNH